MSESTSAPATAPAAGEPRHGLRILTIWLVLTIIAEVLFLVFMYPHLPPGRMSDQAQGQAFDIGVLAVMCIPVLLFIWVYAAYAFTTWRHRQGDDGEAAPVDSSRVQATWITVTSVVVLGLFVFGTVQLILPAGAGAGEGPSPIWRPSGSNLLQVQAIGQQWQWSYRYPQFGGMETTQLLLPLNRQVEIHVTSLDVIHSFWAYQLGVKADANPGVDNVAYVKPQQLGTFIVRCNELCGIWHGAMFGNGQVVTPAAFQAWATATLAREQRSGALAALPPYATTYDPNVIPQLGRAMVKIVGVTGAPGYYYSPANPVQP